MSLRLPNGELEVLATSLLDAVAQPTAEFLTVYHWRWGHKTFYLLLKGRLELENFSGQTVEAVEQDVPAALLLANLESVLSEPAQAALDLPRPTATQPRQVKRANSYHAIKDQVLDLLYRDIPAITVIHKLLKLFAGSPVRCVRSAECRAVRVPRSIGRIIFRDGSRKRCFEGEALNSMAVGRRLLSQACPGLDSYRPFGPKTSLQESEMRPVALAAAFFAAGDFLSTRLMRN